MDIYKNQRHIMSCLYCKYFFLFYFFSLPTPQHHSIQHPFLCLNNVFFPFSSFFLIHFYYPATHSQGMIYIYKRSGWNGSGHQLKPRRMEIFLNNSGLVIKEILFMQKFVVKDSMDYY